MEKSKRKPRPPTRRKAYSLKLPQLAPILNRAEQLIGLTTKTLQNLEPSSWDVDPKLFSDPRSFADAYLAAEMLSKLDDGKPSPEKTSTTWRRFFEAEELCESTNRRLKQPSFGPNPFCGKSPYSAIMLARLKMERLLGPLKLDEVAKGFGWGPGASTRLSRRNAAAPLKFSGRPEATIGNAILGNAAVAAIPLWKEGLEFQDGQGYLNIVPGNRIITVPKTYKTDRTIAIEPCMNMYVQKGFGAVIRNRLRGAGIDLDDQSRNQRLARVGSLAGTLATIDLSMASDTVSYEIVRLLLPPDWFEALEQCRSPLGVLPSDAPGGSRLLRYQKFSSMGNGYTFELETAIFCCLAWAVAELHGEKDDRVSVYGDDIICPRGIAQALMETLEVAGFKPNTKKTFLEGPFRESCGKHFFSGHDVTPFYVRRVPSNLTDLFLLHNQFYRWCIQVGAYSSVSQFRFIIEALRTLAPRAWHKPRLPDGFGDGAFIGTFDECTPTPAPHSLEGFVVRHLAAVTSPKDNQPETTGRLLASLSTLEKSNKEVSWEGRSSISGDIPNVPRVVTVRSLVPQFTLVDPFVIHPLETCWEPLPFSFIQPPQGGEASLDVSDEDAELWGSLQIEWID